MLLNKREFLASILGLAIPTLGYTKSNSKIFYATVPLEIKEEYVSVYIKSKYILDNRTDVIKRCIEILNKKYVDKFCSHYENPQYIAYSNGIYLSDRWVKMKDSVIRKAKNNEFVVVKFTKNHQVEFVGSTKFELTYNV